MSISSFATVISAIQTVNAAITGVTSAPTTVPASLNTADLPCAITTVGSLRGYQQAVGMPRVDVTYEVRVYVAPVAQGEGVDEKYQDMLTLLKRFMDAYHTQQKAGGFFSDNVEQFHEFSADAYPLTFADTLYHGFTIRLTVVQK